jgi:hypothetical protein
MQSKGLRTFGTQCLMLCMVLSFAFSPVARGEAPQSVARAAISELRVQTGGGIEKYARYEVAFDITSMVATNPYFPYDPAAPAGVAGSSGISVNALMLSPGQSDWGQARAVACFYYQPVQELGSGANVGLAPVGAAEWRLRFTPEVEGEWRYKIRVQDASGTAEGAVQRFTCVASNRKGFVRVSTSALGQFEFSDGTPFVSPLVNIEDGNPLNSVANLRANLRQYGENGARFVRWFPTGEGANYFVIPFGDDLRMSWGFGSGARTVTYDVDSARGKHFSYRPYYYTAQQVPTVPGARYRLSFWAKVTGEQAFRAEVGSSRLDVTANGDWQAYSLIITNTAASSMLVYLHGLYMSTDAPAPYNVVKAGAVRLHSIVLQRDETGRGDWGPNVLSRSDPETYAYVDQVGAARLDEVFNVSEQYGVYHKLTLFHKNDEVLNRIQADGSIGGWAQCGWGTCPDNFYSAPGEAARWYETAYARYFLARWGYSPALHSLELGNENDLSTAAYDAGFWLGQYVYDHAPRKVLMTNSFWGWFVQGYWQDATRGWLMDYADKHWYADRTGASGGELISALVNDSAGNVRQTWARFRQYAQQFSYTKPIVRGEAGVAVSGTQPQDPDIARDTQGTYYHKQLWAEVGTLSHQHGGEWYPGVLQRNNLWGMYAAYERYMSGEPVSNGHYDEIGTDLTGSAQITLTQGVGNLRAWGVRDASTGKVLLWIDNANHTWRNVVDGVPITPTTGSLVLQRLPQGTYHAEWWDTVAGVVTETGT